jgi:isoamylase
MLLGGDEIGRTQRGNNNAYAQDNETSWFDWDLDDEDRRLLDFTRGLIRIVSSHPVLHRRRFFQGRRIRGSTVKDLTWYGPDGGEMTDEQWRASGVHAIGLRLAGDGIEERGTRGEPIVDDTLLMVLNAGEGAVRFRLPGTSGRRWQVVLDTVLSDPPADGDGRQVDAGSTYRVAERSLVLLRMPRE